MLIGSVLISVEPNPNNFDAFKANGEDRYARYWANESLIGNFCIPLDLSEVPGVTDGANVTIQIALTGGDGELYQVCMPVVIIGSLVLYTQRRFFLSSL